MKKDDIIRAVLSVVLIIFVWLGHAWAIKLSITLLCIGVEATSLLLKRINEIK